MYFDPILSHPPPYPAPYSHPHIVHTYTLIIFPLFLSMQLHILCLKKRKMQNKL